MALQAQPEPGNASADTTPAEPFLLEDLRGNVLWLTLNRPGQRNPLSSGMITALRTAMAGAADNPAVRVVVISGAGSMFSAGHDLREMQRQAGESPEAHRQRVRQVLDDCASMMLGIVHSPKAVIARVHGTATAAGLQLVSACDLAIAWTFFRGESREMFKSIFGSDIDESIWNRGRGWTLWKVLITLAASEINDQIVMERAWMTLHELLQDQ